MSLYDGAEKWCRDNGHDPAELKCRNDGDGDYVEAWPASVVSPPSAEDLQTAMDEASADIAAKAYKRARRAEIAAKIPKDEELEGIREGLRAAEQTLGALLIGLGPLLPMLDVDRVIASRFASHNAIVDAAKANHPKPE